MWDRVNKINDIYLKSGFHGVIEYVKESLYFALYINLVEEIEDGLWKIQHNGFEEEELLIHSLICSHSLFRKHFVGFCVGERYFFVEDSQDAVRYGVTITKASGNKKNLEDEHEISGNDMNIR